MPDNKPNNSEKRQQEENSGNPAPAPSKEHPACVVTKSEAGGGERTNIEQLEKRVVNDERKMTWLTAAIAFFALCSVIVGVFQWNAMKGQLAEMKSSGVDTHELAQAAQNANNLSRAFFGTFSATPQPQLSRIAFDLGNSGRAIAIISSLTADLTIKKVSDGSTVQNGHREWKGPIQVQSGIGKWFEMNGKWPDSPNQRQEAILNELLQDVITVKVEVRYDSGFGTIEQQSFCQTIVGDERINGPGRPVGFTNQTCDDAPPFVEARRKQLGLP